MWQGQHSAGEQRASWPTSQPVKQSTSFVCFAKNPCTIPVFVASLHLCTFPLSGYAAVWHSYLTCLLWHEQIQNNKLSKQTLARIPFLFTCISYLVSFYFVSCIFAANFAVLFAAVVVVFCCCRVAHLF